MGIHRVREGHVGVYKHLGVYSRSLGEPGYNVKLPWLTSVEEVQVKVETDLVTNIPCGTSGGVMISFDKIEVVNRLRREFVYETVRNYSVNYDHLWIYDKIHHEINQFCTKHTLQEIYIDLFETLDEELSKSLEKDLVRWAPGIEIISVRVTKPRIPESIRANFENIEKRKVEYLIKAEQQKIRLEEERTTQKQELIKAGSELEVAEINLAKELKVKENELRMAEIEASMLLEKQKALSDARFYHEEKELDTIKQLLTPEYLRMTAAEALTQNLTLVVGQKVPTYLGRP